MDFSKAQKRKITFWYLNMLDYVKSPRLIEKKENEAVKEYLNLCEKRGFDFKMIDRNLKKITRRLYRI